MIHVLLKSAICVSFIVLLEGKEFLECIWPVLINVVYDTHHSHYFLLNIQHESSFHSDYSSGKLLLDSFILSLDKSVNLFLRVRLFLFVVDVFRIPSLYDSLLRFRTHQPHFVCSSPTIVIHSSRSVIKSLGPR